MGNEGNIIVRRKYVDVSFIRSKTGHFILKGNSFYDLIFSRQVRRLSKDVIGEISSINYRMKVLSLKSSQRMKRSEKLVKTYDLPPLKTKQTSQKDCNKSSQESGSKQTDLRKGSNNVLGLRSSSPTDGRNYRKMFYSPAPCMNKEFEEETEEIVTTLEEDQSNTYPHIKVEKCDEKLPPVGKMQNSPPEYAQKKPERSASSNSLEVPSPMLKRQNQDGKCVTVLNPNLQTNFSHSESSLMDAVQQDNDDDKGLSSILKPLTITCGKTRSTARSQTSQLTTKRTVSRSLSPRPRLTNRTQATPTLIIKGSNYPN